jgi:aldehyde dehydrogenase (NAD+)
LPAQKERHQQRVNEFGAGGGIELPFGRMKKSGTRTREGVCRLRDMSTLRTMIYKHG